MPFKSGRENRHSQAPDHMVIIHIQGKYFENMKIKIQTAVAGCAEHAFALAGLRVRRGMYRTKVEWHLL